MTIQFSDLQAGDVVRVTIAAHMAQAGLGRKAAIVERPETVQIVQVDGITDVNGQPGRKQAWCRVLVTAKGEDLRGSANPELLPTINFYDPQLGGLPAITFERAQ